MEEHTKRYQALIEEDTKRYQVLMEEQTRRHQALMEVQTIRHQSLMQDQTKRHQAALDEYNGREQALMEDQTKRQQALIETHRRELDRQIRHNENERGSYIAQVDALSRELEKLHATSIENESRLNLVISELNAELDRKTAEHANLRADFEFSNGALDKARASLAANHDLSERLAGELQQIGARCKELEADLLGKKADIDDMNCTIASHRKHIGNLQTLLVDRNEQNQAMMLQIEALYASRSWRMTGPLRSARRFFSSVTNLTRSAE